MQTSFCTYSIFISLVNTEAIITFTETSYWSKEWTLYKRFPHCRSSFRPSLWNSEKSHLHRIENFIHCPGVELNVCCAIKPDHVKSLISEHLHPFQDSKYQQTFFCWQAAWNWKKAHCKYFFFYVFNQYSLTRWDDLSPCTLHYSISLCNRECSLLNTAHMRAWNHQNSILLCVNLSIWGCKSATSDKQRARITSVWESEVRISYDIDLQHYCLLGRVGSHWGQHSLSS